MNTTSNRLLTAVAFTINFTFASAGTVISFFPTGAVKQVQQATVRFSSDMVAMGDPRAKNDPFTISCNAATQKKPNVGNQVSTAKPRSNPHDWRFTPPMKVIRSLTARAWY